MLVIWAVTLLAIDLFAYYPYTFLCILILFLYIYIITLYTPPLFTTFIAFSDNQLPPGLLSISPLANCHKSILPYTPLRTYPLFSYISVLLPLASSPGFGHSMTFYYSFTPLFILFFPYICLCYTFGLPPLFAITLLLAPYPLGKTILFASIAIFPISFSFSFPSQYFFSIGAYSSYRYMITPLLLLLSFSFFWLLAFSPFFYQLFSFTYSFTHRYLLSSCLLLIILRCFPFMPPLCYPMVMLLLFPFWGPFFICPRLTYSYFFISLFSPISAGGFSPP